MFKVHNINWFVVAAFSTVAYIIYYLDKVRTLDPSYKYKLIKKHDDIKQNKLKQLKHRLMAFPVSNNMKDIKKFVILEVLEFYNAFI